MKMEIYQLTPKWMLLQTAIETLKQDSSISDEELFSILRKEALKRMHLIPEETIHEIIYFSRETIKRLKEEEQ